MSLKKQIDDKLNQALKAKDKNIYPTLRLIVSAIKDAEIASRSKGQKEIKDSDIISLLKKMVKQRNESCDVYEKAGRKELLEGEKKEIIRNQLIGVVRLRIKLTAKTYIAKHTISRRFILKLARDAGLNQLGFFVMIELIFSVINNSKFLARLWIACRTAIFHYRDLSRNYKY